MQNWDRSGCIWESDRSGMLRKVRRCRRGTDIEGDE